MDLASHTIYISRHVAWRHLPNGFCSWCSRYYFFIPLDSLSSETHISPSSLSPPSTHSITTLLSGLLNLLHTWVTIIAIHCVMIFLILFLLIYLTHSPSYMIYINNITNQSLILFLRQRLLKSGVMLWIERLVLWNLQRLGKLPVSLQGRRQW